MRKSFASYDLLIFVNFNYTEFNVLENPNDLIDSDQILYHTFLNVLTYKCEDLIRFINSFKNRNGK